MRVSLLLLNPCCLGTTAVSVPRHRLQTKKKTATFVRGGRVRASTVLETAALKALSGGLTGSIAGVAQVMLFMWLRTVMNYQYRHGGDGPTVLKKLWNEGGLRRLYRGLPFAIVQGPLARFGSAASNTLVVAMRDDNVLHFGSLPLIVATVIGSCMTAIYRAMLMPIDTLKIISQVEGKAGFAAVVEAALFRGKIHLLYTGAFAMAAATLIGHFPWFFTFNLLDASIPKQDRADLRALRSACIGFSSSLVSDVVSNPIRVVKTTKQSTAATIAVRSLQDDVGSPETWLSRLRRRRPNRRRLRPSSSLRDDADDDTKTKDLLANSSYLGIILDIARTDGPTAFFVRGLSTRIVTNGLQSIVFTVIWRFLLGD